MSFTISEILSHLLKLFAFAPLKSYMQTPEGNLVPNRQDVLPHHDAPPGDCEATTATSTLTFTQNSQSKYPPSPKTPADYKMAEAELQNITKALQKALQSNNYSQCQQLLSRAKVALLHLNALIPSPQTPKKALLAAREILELGAIVSIRQNNESSPDSFTRYFQQLQPFYSLPAEVLPTEHSQQSRVTGLYLLLLLSQGDYGSFHTMLEMLEMARQSAGKKQLEDDEFIQYPVRLEQALMEGSYDRVWQETKGSNVPGEEYAIFSGVCSASMRFHPDMKY